MCVRARACMFPCMHIPYVHTRAHAWSLDLRRRSQPSLSRFPSQGVAEESERRRERAHMLVGGLADRPQDPER